MTPIDTIITPKGSGIKLGYECYDVIGGKELNWRVEVNPSDFHSTGRIAVKLKNPCTFLKDNIGYFFPHEIKET